MLHFLISQPLLAAVQIKLGISGLAALLAGILILIFPGILNFIVAAYLIVTGLTQVLGL